LPTWDAKESSVLFVASPPAPKDPNSLEAFRYVQSFGDRFSTIREPRIHQLSFDLKSPPVLRVVTDSSTLPGVVLAQPTFVPNSKDIIATGYSLTAAGFRLGLISCTNRPSSIFRLSWPQGTDSKPSIERLSHQGRSARSPRVLYLPEKHESILVYVSNASGGPHDSCSSLHLLELSFAPQTAAPDVLVDTVQVPAEQDDFPGLYLWQLPSSPFLFHGSNGQPRLLLSSVWGSRRVPLLVDLSSGVVEKLEPLEDKGEKSWTVLSTDGDRLAVLVGSGLEGSIQLVVGDFSARETVWTKVLELGPPKNCVIPFRPCCDFLFALELRPSWCSDRRAAGL
jgi:acylaminoacyl-peptidase